MKQPMPEIIIEIGLRQAGLQEHDYNLQKATFLQILNI